MTCAFSVFTVFHSCSSEICEHKTQFFNLSVVSTKFLYVGLSCLPRTWSFTAACILSEMHCWSSSSCLLLPFHLPHPPTPPHTFPLVHLSLLLSVLWYRSSTHHGACAPWRGVHWSDHFISKCEKCFIVMCKSWNLPPVLTLAQHKYVTVRTEWMWVYLKCWKKGKIISANYVLKECTFSTFSMLVLMAKSGIWCFSNLGKL